VDFLIHPHPEVRFKAVRLMYKWDQPEALRHFESVLFSDLPQDRALALDYAFFLPFPAIDSLMIRFLATESDPVLAANAERLFLVNPDPEMPKRLVELAESSGPACRGQLGKLITGVISSLSKAGLVNETPTQLQERLVADVRRRRAAQLLEQCRAAFRSTAAETRASAVRGCETLLGAGVESGLVLVREQAKLETDPSLREALAVLIQRFSPTAAPVDVSQAELSPNERNRWLETLTPETFKTAFPRLRQWLDSLPETDKAPVVLAFGRLGSADEVRSLKKFLKSDVPALVAAVLSALLRIEPDSLPALLPRFLQHHSIVVREAAIRAQITIDKRQAAAWLEQMLGSGRPEQRAVGIFAAGLFAFPEVKSLLVSLMERETETDNLEQLAVMFSAHLDPILLRDLVSALQSEVPVGVQSQVRSQIQSEVRGELQSGSQSESPVRQAKEKRLSALAEILPGGSDLLARLKNEVQQQRVRTPPPYELRRIQELREKTRPSTPPPVAQAAMVEFLARYQRELAMGTGLAALMLFSWLFLWSPGEQKASSPPGSASNRAFTPTPSTRGQPVKAGNVRDVQGGISEVFEDGVWVILDASGEKVFFRFTGAAPRVFKSGDAFRARILINKKESGRIEGHNQVPQGEPPAVG